MKRGPIPPFHGDRPPRRWLLPGTLAAVALTTSLWVGLDVLAPAPLAAQADQALTDTTLPTDR